MQTKTDLTTHRDSPQETDTVSIEPVSNEDAARHIVDYGSATQLTKGNGGRSSESAYPMP